MTETATVAEKDSEQWPGTLVKDQVGIVRCDRCDREWGDRSNGNLVKAKRQFEEHLPECRPGFQPRSVEQIRREIDRERKAAKEKQNEEEGKTKHVLREAKPEVSRSKKTSQPRRKSRSRIQQPELSGKLLENAQDACLELKSIRRVAKRYYRDWDYSSVDALEKALYAAARQGLLATRVVPELVGEILEKVRCTYGELKSVKKVARQNYVDFGYPSQRSLEFAIFGAGQKGLIKIATLQEVAREKQRRLTSLSSRMTDARVQVSWCLYSAGYSLSELGEMASGPWQYASCKNAIRSALLKADYKLRPGKRRKTPPTISREVAVQMIESAR